MSATAHFDFDTIINRRNTHSVKWAVGEGELPLSIADMDFPAALAIVHAIFERAKQGVFGYETVADEWHAAIIHWWKKRYRFDIQRDWLLFCTGVVPAISSIIRRVTAIGDKVLLQPPVYHVFFNSIVNNGRLAECCNLMYTPTEGYRIDFAELEQKLSDPQVTLMLLCNPQNPGGNIWDAETLQRIGTLCKKHSVLVLSDEIHCDLTDPDCTYIPFASVSEECAQNSITCIAPTKTFNLAGLHTAAVVVPNVVLRHKVQRALNTDEIAEPNSFAVSAAIAAYSFGEPWLEELRQYLADNKQMVRRFLAEQVPQIAVTPSYATYLLWLDCTAICKSAHELNEFIRSKTGLCLSDGTPFGGNGAHFLRINTACPKLQLEDGLNRLKIGVSLYEQHAVNRIPRQAQNNKEK